jgi:hypothetical protein
MSNIVDSITNINFLSQTQFNAITAPSNNELYAVEFTPKGFNLFDYKLSNYTLNDPRWLSANAFTWQYSKYIDENYQGYGIAYQHLLEDYNAETTLGAQSETIAGTTVYFRLAADGHKIAPADQETAIQKIYDATGAADYFMIDTTNERFKLPRKQKRQLIATYNNGTNWYNQYSDGWVEQGGKTGNLAWNTSGTTTNVTLPITMKTTTYYVNGTMGMPSASGWHAPGCSAYASSTTTIQIRLAKPNGDTASITAPVYWEVKGYAASVPTQTQLEYYYVGEYTIPALENTAGINTETLNNKADVSDVSHLAFPSDRYISLNAADASGTVYTAPADGWYTYRGGGTGSAVGQYVVLESSSGLSMNSFVTTAGNTVRAYLPVSKGQKCTRNYTTTSHAMWRFVYANGAF